MYENVIVIIKYCSMVKLSHWNVGMLVKSDTILTWHKKHIFTLQYRLRVQCDTEKHFMN